MLLQVFHPPVFTARLRAAFLAMSRSTNLPPRSHQECAPANDEV